MQVATAPKPRSIYMVRIPLLACAKRGKQLGAQVSLVSGRDPSFVRRTNVLVSSALHSWRSRAGTLCLDEYDGTLLLTAILYEWRGDTGANPGRTQRHRRIRLLPRPEPRHDTAGAPNRRLSALHEPTAYCTRPVGQARQYKPFSRSAGADPSVWQP